MDTLLASSFIDEARLRTHLGRDLGAEDDIERRLTWACNRAIAWMETRTRRRLKARNYRTPVTTTTNGSTAAAAASITVVSTADLEVGDDVLAAGLEPGTQVESITSGTAFVPTREVVSVIASGSTLTFGSAPLQVDVPDATSVLYAPEWPLLAANLYGLYWLDASGNRTALTLTGKRVDEASGRIYLTHDQAPAGTLNLQIECRAGYEQPSATALGHPQDWEALSAIQLRVAEVLFMDDSHLRGRMTSVAVGNVSLNAPDQKMPADIEDALRPYWRLSA